MADDQGTTVEHMTDKRPEADRILGDEEELEDVQWIGLAKADERPGDQRGERRVIPSSVNSVSRPAAKAVFKPVTWEYLVSEGGLEPSSEGTVPRAVKSPAACSSAAKTGEISPASVPERGLDPASR